jgi:thymidylate synthase (FAD)
MELFGNTEPEVRLIGLTLPGCVSGDGGAFVLNNAHPVHYMLSQSIEFQVAQAGAVSSGIHPKDARQLNQKLIKLGHHTPFEAVQFNFKVSGISKACGAQISRHRVGQGHVSSSRRYQEQGIRFIYPLLDNIDSEITARAIYVSLSKNYMLAHDAYLSMRNLGAKKGDSRYIIPVASAQERIWWINARALREFLGLRLAPDAEAEIRRLSRLILEIVKRLTPTIFHDFDMEGQ